MSVAEETRETTQETWWNRPCGVREVLVIAVPLVVSTISWTLMHFIDRTFLMWFSTDTMAAAMPAGSISFTTICLGMGIASYVNTFVAQYHGARQHDRIGTIVWQGVWVGIGCIPIFLLLHWLSPRLFEQVGHAPQIARLESDYFRVLMFGAGAVVISAALSSFFSGRGETIVVMIVTGLAAVMNIGLDYIWIFGKFGFAPGGIKGAGAATVVSEWMKALMYFGLILYWDRDGIYRVWRGCRLDIDLLKRLIWFGGPNGLQMFVEMLAFSCYLLLVGQLGELELAATGLAFNVNALAFVPLIGLGVAVSTLVGNQIGQRRADLAARATWTSLTMALIYSGVMGLLYLLVPDAFLWLHREGADPTEFKQLRDITVVLLRFVAAYCLLDAIQIVFASAIKGAGDTRFVLLATICLSPMPIVLGWCGINLWDWGLNQFWLLVTAWITALGLVYSARFLQGKWRTMSVIDLND
jgi:MATE family multidrug resistance protein